MRQCKRRRVFVVGSSNSGKTPFARQVASALGVPLVSASDWFRKNFPPQGSMSRQEHTDAITKFNNEVMRQDPDFNLRYLREHHKLDEDCVIEGFRNPRDFAIEFDPRTDVVVLLRCKETEVVPTVFDEGIQVIEFYLGYLYRIGMISNTQVWGTTMERFAHLESCVASFLATLGVPAPRTLDLSRARITLGLNGPHYYPDPSQFPDPGEGASGPVVVRCAQGYYDALYTRHAGDFEGRNYYLSLVATSDVTRSAP